MSVKDKQVSNQLEVGKPTSKRRFSTKDPLVDELYKMVDDQIFELEQQCHSSYEAFEGGHRITYGNLYRFTKMDGERSLICEKMNKEGVWALSEVAQHPSSQKYGNTPIMWPLKSSSKGSLNVYDFDKRARALWDKALDGFHAQHPEYQNDVEKKRKLLQAGLVLRKKWNKSYGRFRNMTHRHCVKQWWKHFVDRDIFKMWVSITGAQPSCEFTWEGYALLSSHPKLKQIEQSVEKLGKERLLLIEKSYDEWTTLQTPNLIPKEWVLVWEDVKKSPKCVQGMIVSRIRQKSFGFVSYSKEDDNEIYFSSSYSSSQKAKTSFEAYLGQQGHPRVWEMFQYVVAQHPSLSPREQEMVMLACRETSALKSFPHDLPLLSTAIPSFIKVWKEVKKEDFKKWSYGDQMSWMEDVGRVLDHSIRGKKYDIPAPSYKGGYFEKLRFVKDKHEMQAAVASSTSKPAPVRIRRM